MLIVFTISITPKKYFHDLLFHHPDELFSSDISKDQQITTYHYACDFVNVVAIAPFIFCSTDVQNITHHSFNLFDEVLQQFCLQSTHDLFSLRGPPAA